MDTLPSCLDEDATSSEKMMRYYSNNERAGSVDEYTAGSTTPTSSNSRSVATPPMPGPLFPSPEVVESAMWTSSEYSSSESFSSDDEDDPDASDYSSGSYSDSDDGYSDDGTEAYMRTMMHRPPPAPVATPMGRPATAGGAPPKATMPPPMDAPEGLPFGGAEGLPFTLESLKRDLEKVGRVIISSNVGEVAAERAQTLASINWLASHVPNAVLDKLGHEIKDILEGVEEVDEEVDPHSRDGRIGVEQMTNVGCSDSMSEVSDLSQHDDASSDEDEDETMELVEPTDVSNVQICYGDLAAFARTRTSSFFPDEHIRVRNKGLDAENDESKPRKGILVAPDKQPTAMTPGSVLDFLPIKGSPGIDTAHGSMNGSHTPQTAPLTEACGSNIRGGLGILDLIPVKKATRDITETSVTTNEHLGEELNGCEPDVHVLPRPSIDMPERKHSNVEASMPAPITKSSNLKGMKGLFKRFSKKGVADPSFRWPHDDKGQKSLVREDCGLVQSTSEKGSIIRRVDQALTVDSALKPSFTQKQTITHKRALPYSSKYRCALLFVDISGFTKLSRLLDPESLSKVRMWPWLFHVHSGRRL
jgi:hypothetical protein